MRFHVLGLGPIGSLVSHHLRRALPPEHSITLLHKNKQQAKASLLKGSRLTVTHEGVPTTSSDFKSEVFEGFSPSLQPKWAQSETNERITDSDTIESLIVTTKSSQTVPAIRRLLPRLSGTSTIVLLQNGMGVYEALTQEIFRNLDQRPHFILASTSHGAYLAGFYHVVHTNVGDIEFAIVPDPQGRNFEAGFLDENIPKAERRPRLADITHPSEDHSFAQYKSLRNTVAALQLAEPLNASWKPMAVVQLALRRRLVALSIINPLSAVMGCRNGDIFSSPESLKIMERVCQEASDVFAAQIRAETQAWMESNHMQGQASFPAPRLPPALTREALMKECGDMAKSTGGNISPMLSDIRRGRNTDVNYLNGYLLMLGSMYRIPMPATAMLFNLIKMRSVVPVDQML